MRKINLTMLAICVIILLTGCENGNLIQDISQDIQQDTFLESGESISEPLSGEKREEKDAEEPLEEVYQYQESGKIIIVMYHQFGEQETNEYSRSFAHFREDLELLYALGYRTVSLTDYREGTMKVPIGCTPIVLTFDDSSYGQFHLISSGDTLVVDPCTAVGIMEAFYEEHPDFGLNGTFFINQNVFDGEGTVKERLEYLIQRGFEIGNHTSTHVNFSNASAETIQKEIGEIHHMVLRETGYEVDSLALPYGIGSKENAAYLHQGVYESIAYENKIILLVGAEPAPSPTSEKRNLLSLPRVRARGGNKEVACDLYYWLEVMERNPQMKYTRKENFFDGRIEGKDGE